MHLSPFPQSLNKNGLSLSKQNPPRHPPLPKNGYDPPPTSEGVEKSIVCTRRAVTRILEQ